MSGTSETPLAPNLLYLPTPPPPPPPGYAYPYRLASLTSRLGAALLDLLVLLVGAALIAIPFGILAATMTLSFGSASWVVAWLFGPLELILFALWIGYFTYFEGTSGQTPGKRALGIRVVVIGSGRTPDLGRALLRNVLRIVDWFPFLYLIGLVVALVTSRKQRLGDLVAGTIAVRA
ncbi:MAG TPA: RDD family protein [Thermoplasmata archaeon]|nr:RDD family protein [Thermoplasmata archaeon]